MKSEVYKIVDDFLVFLSKNETGSIHDMNADPYTAHASNAIEILKRYQLVHFRSHELMQSIVDFGVNGQDCIDAGGIEAYIKLKEERSKPVASVQVGHTIHGNVSQSDLSTKTDRSFNADSQNTNTPAQTSKKSIPDIVYWILGTAASIATIWGILHEMHVVIKF